LFFSPAAVSKKTLKFWKKEHINNCNSDSAEGSQPQSNTLLHKCFPQHKKPKTIEGRVLPQTLLGTNGCSSYPAADIDGGVSRGWR